MVYALGMKGWVELRSARVAPKAIRTECVHEGVDGSKVTIKQLCFKGGKYITSFKRTSSHGRFLGIKTGQVRPLSQSIINTISEIIP